MSAKNFHRALFSVAIFLLTTIPSICFAQQNAPQKPQTDEVLRINTELVQTGITVVDKQGHFVDGLKQEQFELRIDGKPVAVSFFERVTAGTTGEERQLAAVANATKPVGTVPGASYRGRIIIFFVDDLHLSLDSLARTRSALKYFIENQMMPSDQVAFVSASGQIGFLEQLTDNKAVLTAALARLKPIPNTALDTEQPPMSEYIALQIVNGDRDAAGLYVDKIVESSLTRNLQDKRLVNMNAIYEQVKVRANNIAHGLEAGTAGSLTSLENLLRTSEQITGRKLVFFLSDGFYLNAKNASSPSNSRLQRVIDVATRSGSIIYTIDARGLFAPIGDAAGSRPFDPKGRLDAANVGEGILSQEGLSALADDTGGRFLKNQNYFDAWVSRMLDETSNYYLLAWRPESEEQKAGKFKRVEVSVVGRPDLTARLPRGFFSGQPPASAKTQQTKPSTPEAGSSTPKGKDASLIAALGASSARKGLPLQLSTSFLDVPGTGPVLTASMQMATDVLDYGIDKKQAAGIDLAGVILNDQGKPAGSFKNRLNINPLANKTGETPGVIYNHKIPLKPGLYQVRVAALEEKGGRVGSAAQWIEIPDLSSKRLTLSSLLIGGQFVGSSAKQTTGAATSEQLQFSVDRRFSSGSHMTFLTIIYSAAPGDGTPNLDGQIEISRDGRPVVASPVRKIAVDPGTDLARIPYGADIALRNLSPGRYLLKVTVNDRSAGASASNQILFDVE
jgi:VWFA-related protein